MVSGDHKVWMEEYEAMPLSSYSSVQFSLIPCYISISYHVNLVQYDIFFTTSEFLSLRGGVCGVKCQ